MPDWTAVFVPNTPILEIVVRGTLVFLSITVLLRLTGQREAGSLAVTDLLVVVLIATAVGEAMSGGYRSVSEGIVLVGTILVWSVVLDAASYRFPALRRLLKARPRTLVRDGEANEHVMHREFLTREELEVQLRLHGVRRIDDVAVAFLEPNGMVSVFRKDDADASSTPRPPVT